ncbi:hypothetical protein [Rhizobium tumorigenes]|uniref:hypothetical protein n=1 Tax=Rhizobium tumorigenes TaxID=2041385 RepID=UPI0012B6A319
MLSSVFPSSRMAYSRLAACDCLTVVASATPPRNPGNEALAVEEPGGHVGRTANGNRQIDPFYDRSAGRPQIVRLFERSGSRGGKSGHCPRTKIRDPQTIFPWQSDYNHFRH